MHGLSKRPRPKPNPDAIKVNLNDMKDLEDEVRKMLIPKELKDLIPKGNTPIKNFQPIGKTPTKDSEPTKKLMGNIGDPSTLAWLFCDLQPFGKVIIRKGKRAELPIDKPSIWVFCPLLKGKFPRDRCLVEDCEKCKHYKGVNHSLTTGNQNATPTSTWSPTMVQGKKRREPKTSFSKDQLAKELQELADKEKVWKEEERKLFPPKTRKKKVSHEVKE